VSRAIVLAYHGIEVGPRPLWIDPARFREHLDTIAASGAEPVSLSRIVRGLRDGDLPERCVAVTFDDGLLSVVENAVPLLAERGIPATVFCVAGWLGRTNDWPSQPPGVPRRQLAGAGALADAAAAPGIEIGSHGTDHAPLVPDSAEHLLRREIVDSRAALEHAVGVPVRHFAYAYDAASSPRAYELVASTYDGACAGANQPVSRGSDPLRIPRVDSHYLRRPALLRRALEGDGSYLALRRAGGRARRLALNDWR
jgi:peptidoglycan/xylan/chitin deacetylase (PgdA/CDA1 family)